MNKLIEILTIILLGIIETVSIIRSIRIIAMADDKLLGATLGFVYTFCATSILLVGLGFIFS